MTFTRSAPVLNSRLPPQAQRGTDCQANGDLLDQADLTGTPRLCEHLHESSSKIRRVLCPN